jgi:hypothetical protein
MTSVVRPRQLRQLNEFPVVAAVRGDARIVAVLDQARGRA